ncbi:hypothetical protein [uncultured Enterococcus sp.]|uniref:hypothetical protein n=1 Tax=uncultured Enterococcus sp. TaxID=167972 RepID=UPI002AA6518B|nr:hypothetical protein [uncultured Enterococcus sp.]
MADTIEHTDEFSSQEKAEAFLIDTLEKEFEGRTFTIYSRDKNTYTLNGENYGTSLYSYITDQDGNVANSGITADGKLWTDYLPSFYMEKLAEPIEALLNQFDFVENYAITLDDWDESDSFNNLDWTVDEFFEHTRRRYQISVVLSSGKDAETYIAEITKIYNSIFDLQEQTFDLEFILSNHLYYGISNHLGGNTEYYYGFYISHQINNHTSNFGKDSEEMIKKDLKPLDQEDTYNVSGFNDYGVVWKHLPEKITE